MSKTFYGSFLSAVAFAAMVVMPMTASGQQGVWIDGVQVSSSMTRPYNNAGTIGTATINNDGYLSNTGTITNATVNNGNLYNFYNITNATVNDGYLANVGTINNLTFNGGTFVSSEEGGTVGTATINGGVFNNQAYIWSYPGASCCYYGTINNVTMTDGTLNNNGSRINNMTYVGGTYNSGQVEGWDYEYDWEYGGYWDPVWRVLSGSIGTLALAGDSANNTGNWGRIEKLAFDNGGNGLITLTASANPAMAMAAVFNGIMPANTALPGISFYSNITAQNIDFTYGNIALDLSGLTGFSENDILSSLFAEGFLVASLFGSANVTGFEGLNSFALDFASGSLSILSDGVFANGWSFADGFITWNGGAEVPEPATLLMLGLAAAGLPVVRRWRKG